jgi:hypothetical protein
VTWMAINLILFVIARRTFKVSIINLLQKVSILYGKTTAAY